ncbi:molybdate ABC transporter substrate-binding protein [Sporosarcina siberiensis]|uniref:Molybdate ABC transporter substrate-binding protein n=1 Tax=Sporosarcina siberiensis TaxID=1365606 RepID=A0ABW4SEX1_9BACL
MNILKLLLFSIVFLLVLSGCVQTSATEENPKAEKDTAETVRLTVSAAVSLTDALEEIKTNYEKNTDVELIFNLGGSGSLAQQIQQGAPVDVFISANQDWMDTLDEQDLILKSTREDITGNKLVLIAGSSSNLNYRLVNDISADDIKQISIGNPESVPVGKYSEQVLKNLKMWNDLENKLILGKNVRQVLTYVETGNVDIGFVYESDALSSENIKILTTVEDGLHEPIIYPAAVLTDTKHEKESTEFVTYIASEEAQKVLAKYGFKK